jgi:RHS repeat-associated protein
MMDQVKLSLPMTDYASVNVDATYLQSNIDTIRSSMALGALSVAPAGAGSLHTTSSVSSSATSNDSSNPCPSIADPIEMSSGSKIENYIDFALPGEMGLRFERFYQSKWQPLNTPGGWTTNLDYFVTVDTCDSSACNPIGDVITFSTPTGRVLKFSGIYSFPQVGTAGIVALNETAKTITIRDEDGYLYSFTYTQYPSGPGYYGSDSNLTSIQNPSGVKWTISHPNASTTTVTHSNGQSYSISRVSGSTSYGASEQINVTDPAGNVYAYQSTGPNFNLSDTSNIGVIQSVTYPGSPATNVSYKYFPDVTTGSSTSYAQLKEVDYNGVAHDVTGFDSSHNANMTSMADGTEKVSVVYGTNSTGRTATVTNALGHVSVYQYNGSNLLVSITGQASEHCAATFAQNTYDIRGFMATSKDNIGNLTQYTYGANGLLQKKTEAAGTAAQRITDFTWDTTAGTDRPLAIKIEGLSETDFTYDSNNRLASQTLKNLTTVGTQPALTTTYAYTYFANGLVHTRSITHPSPNGSNTTIYTFDTLGNLATIADALGHTATYSNYNLLGLPGQISGPNGDVTNYNYDARGRVASIVRHPNGVAATWTYAYDGFGLPSGVTTPDNSVSAITRNAYMQVTSATLNDKDGTSTESFAYDAKGDVITHTVARGSDIGLEEKATYDALGRLYQKQGMHGQALTYAYDLNDNVVSVSDALSHATTYQYDALNRVSQSTDPTSGITKYTHDTGDHITSVTDPRGLVTTYAYDGLGQLWNQSSPDTGTTTFAYDIYGRRTSLTRADAVQTTYGYDTLNRPTSVSAGGQTQIFVWDACTKGIGRLCSASNMTNTISYSYTPEGWIAGRGFAVASSTYTLGYSYNNTGQLASVIYPDGNKVLYAYTNGAISGVTATIGGVTTNVATSVLYRPNDLAMSSWTSSNGLINRLAYDSDGRLTGINVSGVQSQAFAYDAANRITQITDGIDGSMTETLGYDGSNRLMSEISGVDNESFSYDAVGNRIHQVINGATTTYTMAATSNHLVTTSGASNTTWLYDADGAMTSANGAQIWYYSPFHRLINANGTDYLISAEGQRLRKMGGPGTTYFAPDRSGTLLAENQNGTWTDYVWLNERVAAAIVGGGVYPVHSDQTGRPVAVTAIGSPTVLWKSRGLPFSTQITTNIWQTFNLGFPGQYHDSESGMWQNGARDYNAYLGRYIESDPIGLAGGVNTYAYVGNNPIMGIDPYGLWDWPALPQGFVDASAGFGDALSFGITGWARGKLRIGSVNECSGFYHGGQAAGIVAGLIDGEGEADIAFQSAHYAPRLLAEGVDVGEAEAAVAGEVNATLSMRTEGTAVGPFSGRISVGDTQVEYRAFPLSNGTTSVGTIFPVKW